jgi:hypothetical protein
MSKAVFYLVALGMIAVITTPALAQKPKVSVQEIIITKERDVSSPSLAKKKAEQKPVKYMKYEMKGANISTFRTAPQTGKPKPMPVTQTPKVR